MTLFLQRYLRRHSLSYHLVVALVLGSIVRGLSAYFVYGPQALDDYKHGVWPAYQYFSGQSPDLPAYRSHLLTWLLAGFLRIGSWFGVESAISQVRWMYFGLAGLSLVAIVGCYLYVSCSRSRIFGGLALYLLAIFPVMPFVSTRAFGEAIALSFVVLGLAICEWTRRNSRPAWQMTAGIAVLGIAVFFRFQVGVIVCVYSFYLLVTAQWRYFAATIFAGLILLVGQAGIDVASGKTALATLQSYLSENAGGAAKYGTSPWYNTWLLMLGLTLFPFSLVFVPKLKYLLKRHMPMMACLLAFVFAHSLVAHKEERFLYPVFGLTLIALAYVWALSRHDRGTKKIYFPVFSVVLVLLLPVCCLVNSQAGEIEPAAEAERAFGHVAYLDDHSLFAASLIQDYFLRPPSRIFPVEASGLTLDQAETELAQHPEFQGVEFLTSEPEDFVRVRALANQSSTHLTCGEAREASSFVDRLLYRMNPKHNQRRRPTVYILCERK